MFWKMLYKLSVLLCIVIIWLYIQMNVGEKSISKMPVNGIILFISCATLQNIVPWLFAAMWRCSHMSVFMHTEHAHKCDT